MSISEKEKIIVTVDAMGGDHAPEEPCKGAVSAVNEADDLIVKLTGDEAKIKAELSKYSYDTSRIEIINATQVIDTEESPVKAIQTKKDSSMVKAFYMLKNDEADAMVSCGNTGALLVGGQTIVGRIKGIQRAALAFMVPTLKGPSLLIDCGANVDAKPSNLVQFAQMGYIYMRDIVGIDDPKVGLMNIGEEEEKGNALVKETFPLLKELKDINFIGSVESRSIPEGDADVVVSDAFVGNLILKMYEGASKALLTEVKDAMMANIKTKLGALMIKGSMKETLKKFSVEEYGGAPLLGIKKMIIKSHGNSEAVEIKNSILQSISCVRENVVEKIGANQ